MKEYMSDEEMVKAIEGKQIYFWATENRRVKQLAARYSKAAKKRRNLKKWAKRFPAWNEPVSFCL